MRRSRILLFGVGLTAYMLGVILYTAGPRYIFPSNEILIRELGFGLFIGGLFLLSLILLSLLKAEERDEK